MKRLLEVLLIMCMAVSVCACGEKEEKLYKVGESASTDRAVVTMNSAELEEMNNSREICVNFFLDIENIGNTALDDSLCREDGRPYTNSLSAYILLEYDEVIYQAYESSDHWVCNRTTWDEYFKIPKGKTHKFEGRFYLPLEAMTNDKPILVHVKLPNSKGKFETFKFKLK